MSKRRDIGIVEKKGSISAELPVAQKSKLLVPERCRTADRQRYRGTDIELVIIRLDAIQASIERLQGMLSHEDSDVCSIAEQVEDLQLKK